MILQTLRGETDIKEIVAELKEIFEIEEEIYELQDEAFEIEEEIYELQDETFETEEENPPKPEAQEIAIVSQEGTPVLDEEIAIQNTDQFFVAMDIYKQTFLNEVKEEIRSVLRKKWLKKSKKRLQMELTTQLILFLKINKPIYCYYKS